MALKYIRKFRYKITILIVAFGSLLSLLCLGDRIHSNNLILRKFFYAKLLLKNLTIDRFYDLETKELLFLSNKDNNIDKKSNFLRQNHKIKTISFFG